MQRDHYLGVMERIRNILESSSITGGGIAPYRIGNCYEFPILEHIRAFTQQTSSINSSLSQ